MRVEVKTDSLKPGQAEEENAVQEYTSVLAAGEPPLKPVGDVKTVLTSFVVGQSAAFEVTSQTTPLEGVAESAKQPSKGNGKTDNPREPGRIEG